jgi:hypothetical protein
MQPWKRYELVAQQLLDMVKADLGLSSVGPGETLGGASGTQWAIDGSARNLDGQTVIIECRRKTRRLEQEDVAAVAYRIRDTGSAGGLIVSPEPLQSGARIVADAEGIEHIELSADSTPTDYLMKLLGRRFVGASVHDQLDAQDSASCEVIRGGKVLPP